MLEKNKNFYRQLPKIDLHCHLDGSVRAETLYELGKKSGRKLPDDFNEFKKYVSVPPDCRSLSDFLKAFEFFYDFLKSPEAVERIAYELCEDAAKENIMYLEVRFAPVLQGTKNFPPEEVVRVALRGLIAGERDFKIKARALICLYRSLSDELNTITLEVAKKFFGRGVVGIDLAGDESRYPTELYEKFFLQAKKYGLPITCHAGEAAGPESIRQAIKLGAKRIGHGVRAIQDEELLKILRDEGIVLEVCLTSNVQTRVVNDFSEHPLPEFVRRNLLVTLNTDDRGVSDIDLTNEFEQARKYFGFSPETLKTFVANAIVGAFLDESEKQQLQREWKMEIKRLREKLRITNGD